MASQAEAIDHYPETREFWSALDEGRFLIRHCRQCQRTHWYPRAICPHCASSETGWQAASGDGIIYSYSISRTAKPQAAIAYVKLAEGPTMMTSIVDSSFDDIAIGKPVRLVIRKGGDDIPLPLFTLA